MGNDGWVPTASDSTAMGTFALASGCRAPCSSHQANQERLNWYSIHHSSPLPSPRALGGKRNTPGRSAVAPRISWAWSRQAWGNPTSQLSPPATSFQYGLYYPTHTEDAVALSMRILCTLCCGDMPWWLQVFFFSSFSFSSATRDKISARPLFLDAPEPDGSGDGGVLRPAVPSLLLASPPTIQPAFFLTSPVKSPSSTSCFDIKHAFQQYIRPPRRECHPSYINGRDIR